MTFPENFSLLPFPTKTIEADGKRKTVAGRFSENETKQTRRAAGEEGSGRLVDEFVRLIDRGWTSNVAGNLCPIT